MIVLSIDLKGETEDGGKGTLYVGQFMGFPGSASRRLLESVLKKIDSHSLSFENLLRAISKVN